MDNDYIDGECSETSYVRNSTGKGNYGNSYYINTGSNENYKVKRTYMIWQEMHGNGQ